MLPEAVPTSSGLSSLFCNICITSLLPALPKHPRVEDGPVLQALGVLTGPMVWPELLPILQLPNEVPNIRDIHLSDPFHCNGICHQIAPRQILLVTSISLGHVRFHHRSLSRLTTQHCRFQCLKGLPEISFGLFWELCSWGGEAFFCCLLVGVGWVAAVQY